MKENLSVQSVVRLTIYCITKIPSLSAIQQTHNEDQETNESNEDAPLFRLVPHMVQLLSLSEFVLQPQASQVHRCPAETDPGDASS